MGEGYLRGKPTCRLVLQTPNQTTAFWHPPCTPTGNHKKIKDLNIWDTKHVKNTRYPVNVVYMGTEPQWLIQYTVETRTILSTPPSQEEGADKR